MRGPLAVACVYVLPRQQPLWLGRPWRPQRASRSPMAWARGCSRLLPTRVSLLPWCARLVPSALPTQATSLLASALAVIDLPLLAPYLCCPGTGTQATTGIRCTNSSHGDPVQQVGGHSCVSTAYYYALACAHACEEAHDLRL